MGAKSCALSGIFPVLLGTYDAYLLPLFLYIRRCGIEPDRFRTKKNFSLVNSYFLVPFVNASRDYFFEPVVIFYFRSSSSSNASLTDDIKCCSGFCIDLLQNFAKEFDDVLDSKQNVQELFSSSAVAIPLVALASLLLFRAPLTDLLEGINSQ